MPTIRWSEIPPPKPPKRKNHKHGYLKRNSKYLTIKDQYERSEITKWHAYGLLMRNFDLGQKAWDYVSKWRVKKQQAKPQEVEQPPDKLKAAAKTKKAVEPEPVESELVEFPKIDRERGEVHVIRRGRGTGIYAIRFPAYPDMLKIGVAADIEERLANLQTAWPEPLQLLAFVPTTGNAEKIERKIHRILNKFRVKRGGGTEFFTCPIDQFEEVATQFAEIQTANR